jgi:hypothetical protein
MRRVTTTLALALCLLGCGLMPGPVELLTGVDACYAGGEHATFGGLLVADSTYGTPINSRPIMWPVGFTGVRLGFGGEVAVRNRDGKVVATTGREYRLSSAPHVLDEKRSLMERIDAFPAAGDCYGWDIVDEGPPSP